MSLLAFLVIDQPRQRLSHWSTALSPLDDPQAPPYASVIAHYDPLLDQALIALRYDAANLGDHGLAFLVELALLAEVGVIQPAELSEGDRKRFLTERLARCVLTVENAHHVTSALNELVRRLREQRVSQRGPALQPTVADVADAMLPLPKRPGSPRPASPPPLPAAALGRIPRGDTEDPHLLVKAKGTRDDLGRGSQPPATTSRVAGSDRMKPLRDVHRAETVEMDAGEVARHAVETLPSLAAPSTTIYARYLRSGRWVPIRIGALSLKGAALMSGALPRVNDNVDVALSFGGHRALVRGSVGKVSSVEETASSGASTFSVDFRLDDASRRQLTGLLTAARAAKVTIKPPPARAARRFPVEWPVGLGTSKGVVRAEALDVSKAGLFVRPLHALAMGSTVSFSSVLDDGGAPVNGRAKVIRHITEAEARAQGLAPGYGLSITDMGDDARARWLSFLARIEKRAERRILIGASPARMAELQTCLAAAGYAVTGGTDPGALVQLASAEARPVDAALIDAAWLSPQMSSEWVESLFSARNVPCVTLHGDAKRARATIDRLLGVE